MNRTRIVIAAIMIAVSFLPVPAARAGAWVADFGCDTLNMGPPRVAMKVILIERHTSRFRRLAIWPLSYQGSPALPILGYRVPSRFKCTIEAGTGRAVFTPAHGESLDIWSTADSLALIVGGFNSCFGDSLVLDDGSHMGFMCFFCATDGLPVGVGDTPGRVDSNYLELRSENPWRSGEVRIVFGLATTERVGLRIYDMAGRRVRTLADREFEGGQEHGFRWDGADDSGRRVGRGVYFCQLRSASYASQKKLVVIKD